jgi:hypothetical protein
MRRRHVDEFEDDDEEDDGVDPEGPDPSEMDSSDDPDLEVCPYCRKMIYDDAERCSHCGRYLSAEDAPLSPTAWVTIGIVVVLILATLFWVL